MGTTQIKRAGDKKMKSVKRADAISAVELLGLMGFAFLLAWMFVSFFWLFRDFPPDVPLAVRDMSQLAIFAGMPVGYVLMHLLGRIPRFNLFSIITTGVELVCGLSLPIVAFAIYQNVHVPLLVVYIPTSWEAPPRPCSRCRGSTC